ncbi:MAG TPA: DUF202 domain-containing protein [Streptosporangiaceae bacterium]
MPPDGPVLPDDPEDADPGLARERTRLAWTRTAIAFGALGVALLRKELAGGLVVLGLGPLVWLAGQVAGQHGTARRAPQSRRLLLVTASVVLAAVLAAAVALLARGPASLHDLFPLHGHG